MTKEVQSSNDDTHPVHRTTLRTELSAFENSLANNLPPGYSPGLQLVSNVAVQRNLNRCIRLGLNKETLEQNYKPNYPFLQASCSHHGNQAAVFQCRWYSIYGLDCTAAIATGANMEAIGTHCKDHLVFWWRHVGNWETVINLCFSHLEGRKLWIDDTLSCPGWLFTTVPWKLE